MQPDNSPVSPQDPQTLCAEAAGDAGAEPPDWKALYLEAQRAREQAEAEAQRLRDRLERLKDATIAQARLAAIVESSDDAIIAKTLQAIITDWNKGAERIFGYTAEEAIGKSKLMLFPTDRYAEEDEILAKLRRGERIEHFESVRVTKDGRYIDVSLSISPIRDGEGNIVGASTIARDITLQKQAQRELTALNERLKRSVQETHHRVKNNLQILAAFLDMLMQDYAEALPITEVQRLSQQVSVLAGIHDILTHDPKTLGENDADTKLPANVVLERLLTLLETTARQQRLEYHIPDIRLSIRQATALTLIVHELVLNALKYGGKTVQVSMRAEGSSARLEVQDDGQGLPADFDPDLAANTGLALVESLTRNDLGGRLVFTNRKEGGAKVSLQFPLRAA
ncbi:MAG TPA: PAS domain S-box protein [Chthonomonadaceae bacterium]|nr:PAS domain S-box protein [Chthonomonadaceae bacterium]